MIHIIAINTEMDLSEGSAQYEFIEHDLWALNRTKTPWVVVGGHRPIYSVAVVGDEKSGFKTDLQKAVEGLFHQYGVDFYFCGHEHSYERQYPTHAGETVASYDEPPYTVHILTGAGGSDEGHSEDYEQTVDAPWNAFWDDTHWGHGVLTVKSASEVVWTQYIAATGEVLDTVTVTKTH